MVVCKFGGSSLADSGQIEKVRNIIEADSQRRLIVVSAPGKRSESDIKITDLLYTCAEEAAMNIAFDSPFKKIEERFLNICFGLGVDEKEIQNELFKIKKNISDKRGADYAASRGEFLSAKMLGLFLHAEFIDAADVIRLTADGRVDTQSYDLLRARITSGGRYIIPGFFGTDPFGRIKTFSRGGSDITGAVASRAVSARLYENWTDVSGLRMADPRIFDNPPPVPEITYREIRELASLGANVFHEEAIAPVKDIGIPINIKNTNKPEDSGTMITASRASEEVPVAGISGKSGYIPVTVEKFMLNRYPDFPCGILRILNTLDAGPDFSFYGNDSIVYMVNSKKLLDMSVLKDTLLSDSDADKVEIGSPKGIIGIVGEGLIGKTVIGAKILGNLTKESIDVYYISYGGSYSTFLLGVDLNQYPRALQAVYNELKQQVFMTPFQE